MAGKTGYTKVAGNTLVTYAKKDGKELIVVILKSKGTHYTDTKALLDYGFGISSESDTKSESKSGSEQEGKNKSSKGPAQNVKKKRK
mgnify:CR=1 FL=1